MTLLMAMAIESAVGLKSMGSAWIVGSYISLTASELLALVADIFSMVESYTSHNSMGETEHGT
jgi:hypothetical protein